MKRYGSMEKSVIYVSILAFVGVVVLIICLGMAAASDNSVVANVNVDDVDNVETEKIGITLNTKDGLVLDTSLNNATELNRDVVHDMLSKRNLNIIITDIITFRNNVTTTISPDIISVNLPIATTIGREAFDGCISLTSVNFPNVTTIDSYAFDSCTSLTSVNFPNAITIGDQAFDKCTSLTSVNFPNVTTIDAYAFFTCTSLTSVNFPNVKNISAYAFDGCASLTSVNFPNVSTIAGGAFNRCASLTSVNFPTTVTLTGVMTGNFTNCYRLGEGILTLTVHADSVNVVDDKTGISQGRNAATYNNGVITFGQN